MPTPWRRLKLMLAAGSCSVALLGSGCGWYDGVELNGGVFDLLGVSSSSQRKKEEPKVATRSGLVLPPVADRLPEPGSNPPPAALTEAFPDDNEARKARVAAELDRQHEEFCRKALLNAKLKNDEATPITGPKGPCTPSVLRSLVGSSGSQ